MEKDIEHKEMPENVDDLIDDLPPHLRNKLIGVYIEKKPPPPSEAMNKFSSGIAMMCFGVGILFCLTIVGIPIGLVFIMVGAAYKMKNKEAQNQNKS